VTLALANVAVNPLSNSRDVATGTTAIGGMDTRTGYGQPKQINGETGMQGSQGAQGVDPALDLTQMARLTGGHAYFRQDILPVLKQVTTDAAGAYEITYAPPADHWDNKFHVIRVACTRESVKLQARERYYALADARPPMERMKGFLVQAFQSPTDLVEIGVRAKIAPLGGDKKGVHLEIRIDPSDLLLQREPGGKYSGALYCLISDRSASAPLGEPAVSELKPDLSAEQYKTVIKDGLPFTQDHPIGDGVRQVRVIILDEKTNAVGSLTVPVQ
jgi:hypothetical protein